MLIVVVLQLGIRVRIRVIRVRVIRVRVRVIRVRVIRVRVIRVRIRVLFATHRRFLGLANY